MKNENKKIVIVGAGKVAHQIGKQLSLKGHTITGLWNRNQERTEELAKELSTQTIKDLKDLPTDSLAIICVSDGAIAEVIKQIPPTIKVAYTSGSVGLPDLPERVKLGVFYPLQTFSLTSQPDISKVPFLIEATNKEFENELVELANTISETVLLANSTDRFNTHIAAVMVNNFTNFLYLLAEKHLTEHQLDFKILKPLIQETVSKLEHLSPKEAQTGPAVRGDNKVIDNHINALSDPDSKELYQLFSELIKKEFN